MQTHQKRNRLTQEGQRLVPSDPIAEGMSSLVDGASRKDLPEAMRQKMENAFGADFSNLNIYESEKVAEGGAKAVTQGNTIAFAPGEFNVYSPGSEALLGHELSHVVSQARGESKGSGLLTDSYLEAKADREGVLAAAGQQIYSGPVIPLSDSSPLSVAGPMQCKKGNKKAQSAPVQQEDDFSDWETVNAPNDQELWDNLARQGQSDQEDALKETYADLSKREESRLTEGQRNAASNYLKESYPMNVFLRGNQDTSTKEGRALNEQVQQLDTVMKPTKTDLTAYRAVSDDALYYIIRQDPELMKLVMREDGTVDHEALWKNKDRLKGVEFSDRSFSSTTVSKSFADKFKNGMAGRDVVLKRGKAIKDYYIADFLKKKSFQKMVKNSNSASLKGKKVKNMDDFFKLDQRAQSSMLNLGFNYLSDQLLQDKKGMDAKLKDPEFQKLLSDNNLGGMYGSHRDIEEMGVTPVFRSLLLQKYAEKGREGFMTERQWRKKGGFHRYDISVPKGTRASMLSYMLTGNNGERFNNNGSKKNMPEWEMLLDRDTRFKINDLEQIMDESGKAIPNQFRILMEVVSQKKKQGG